MTRTTLTTALLAALALAGCANTRSAGIETVAWSMDDRELGRTALLIELEDTGPERSAEEKAEEVTRIADEVVGDLPGTSLIDREALRASLGAERSPSAVSDYQLVMAARSHGLDTIGRLTVDSYLGTIAIGLLPLPGWSAHTLVAYRLRLLDVASGTIVADVRRWRRTGEFFGTSRREYLPRDFRNDLTELVHSAPPPARSGGLK